MKKSMFIVFTLVFLFFLSCQEETQKETQKACLHASHCDSGEICKHEVCVPAPIECTENTECSDGKICKNNKCQYFSLDKSDILATWKREENLIETNSCDIPDTFMEMIELSDYLLFKNPSEALISGFSCKDETCHEDDLKLLAESQFSQPLVFKKYKPIEVEAGKNCKINSQVTVTLTFTSVDSALYHMDISSMPQGEDCEGLKENYASVPLIAKLLSDTCYVTMTGIATKQ